MTRTRTNAFTLLETLFVVTMIAALGAFAVASWSTVPDSARFQADVANTIDMDLRCRALARTGGRVIVRQQDGVLIATRRGHAETLLYVEIESLVEWTVDGEFVQQLVYSSTGRCDDYELRITRDDREARFQISGLTGWTEAIGMGNGP